MTYFNVAMRIPGAGKEIGILFLGEKNYITAWSED